MSVALRDAIHAEALERVTNCGTSRASCRGCPCPRLDYFSSRAPTVCMCGGDGARRGQTTTRKAKNTRKAPRVRARRPTADFDDEEGFPRSSGERHGNLLIYEHLKGAPRLRTTRVMHTPQMSPPAAKQPLLHTRAKKFYHDPWIAYALTLYG